MRYLCSLPLLLLLVACSVNGSKDKAAIKRGQGGNSSAYVERKVARPTVKTLVDNYNDLSYRYRYISIDSTLFFANQAYHASDKYADGRFEAMVNRAFVAYQQMNFDMAQNILSQVRKNTRNQYIHLCADVLMMKIAQRIGDGETFFKCRNRAIKILDRIGEGNEDVGERYQRLVNYASSELHIVSSTYYYYLGLDSAAIDEITLAYPPIHDGRDTAQWLNYNYMLGSGGLIVGDSLEVCLTEFDHLFRTYTMAMGRGYVYFEANTIQSFATLLSDSLRYHWIQQNRGASLDYIYGRHIEWGANDDLCVALSRHAISLFTSIKDLFQTACAYRTMGEIYFSEGRYDQAFRAFHYALALVEDQKSRSTHSVKPWMAGIREKMSLAYSALGDKQMSDYNRNIYLELLDQSRQNYESETRLQELTQELHSIRLRTFILLVLIAVSLVLFVLLTQRMKSRARVHHRYISDFRNSDVYQSFVESVEAVQSHLTDEIDISRDDVEVSRLHIENYRSGNFERRAKVALVYSIIPYLDRMLAETKKMQARNQVDAQGLQYTSELSREIQHTNSVLTDWIKMSHGRLNLHVSTFSLQKLLDVIAHSRFAFNKKNIRLLIPQTDATVKADEALTLFMINTLVDNARKFTPEGGTVQVEVNEQEDYVEIGVADTGIGLSEEDVAVLNDNKVYNARDIGTAETEKGSGFGIMNCKGIINNYRKLSQTFSVCQFGVASTLGHGSRFWFRLPRVVMLLCLLLSVSTARPVGFASPEAAFYSISRANVMEHYEDALLMGDSLLHSLSTPMDTAFVVALRNEISISALALHRWDVYKTNNTECVRLHKLYTQDNSIEAYCQQMEKLQADSILIYVLLVVFALLAGLLFYFLFLRGRLRSARQYRDLVTDFLELIRRARQSVSRYGEEGVSSLQALLDGDTFPQDAEQMRSGILSLVQDDASLYASVDGIMQDVDDRYEAVRRQVSDLLSALEEKQKLSFEENRLYVMNQILDNCLSTIKHETMYYPARAQQMLEAMQTHETTMTEVNELNELLTYYKGLYMLLYSQAERQLEQNNFRRKPLSLDDLLSAFEASMQKTIARSHSDVLFDCHWPRGLQIMGDAQLLQKLLDILTQEFLPVAKHISLDVCEVRDGMVEFSVSVSGVMLSQEELDCMFAPSSSRIPFLIARQIVREHDAYCGYPGLRLYAVRGDEASFSLRFNVLKIK